MFIETSDITQRAENLHPTTVGRIIAPLIQGNILSLSSSSTHKVSVTLKDRISPNKLLNNPCFTEANLKASIPAHKLNRQAIIRGVPVEYAEEEILNYLQSFVPILGVRRLNRKVLSKDAVNKAELIPTRTILLTYNSQSLPSDVFIFLVRYNLEVYVPPTKMCFKCFRYGHLQTLCRSKTTLCMKCCRPFHQATDACSNRDKQATCINYQGSHLPNDKACPELLFQKKVHSYAAMRNTSLYEACIVLRRSDPPSHVLRSNFDVSSRPLPALYLPVLSQSTPVHSRLRIQVLIAPHNL